MATLEDQARGVHLDWVWQLLKKPDHPVIIIPGEVTLAEQLFQVTQDYFYVVGEVRYPDGTQGEEQFIVAVGKQGDDEALKTFALTALNPSMVQGAVLFKPGNGKLELHSKDGTSTTVGNWSPEHISDLIALLKPGMGTAVSFTLTRLVNPKNWLGRLGDSLREKKAKDEAA